MLQLSGNSFGVEASKAIGDALAKKPHLSRALWSDMFVSRLKSEIPSAMVNSITVNIYCYYSCYRFALDSTW